MKNFTLGDTVWFLDGGKVKSGEVVSLYKGNTHYVVYMQPPTSYRIEISPVGGRWLDFNAHDCLKEHGASTLFASKEDLLASL